MTDQQRIAYDEFGLFHENAAEYGLPFDEQPVVRRERVAVAPDRSLSMLVWGEGEPQLVLLHGGAQNAHTWDTVALALRPLPLVAVDLPGHGHSDGPGLEQLEQRSPRAAAEDVAVVVREAAPRARAIVGMSYGGLTAIALAGVAPELVRKLVLVDVLPGMSPDRAQHIRAFVNGPITFDSFDDMLARTIEFNPTRSVSSLRRGILHNAIQLEDGSWMWRHSRWRNEGTNVEQDPASASIGSDSYAELDRVLGRVSVPVLLARGMRPDSVLGDEDERDFRARLPAATVVQFGDAGHSVQGDMPVELAAAIRDFVV